MSASKIIRGLKDVWESIGCDHSFQFVHDQAGNGGIVGRCRRCRMRVTTWPGGEHYDEIKLAERKKRSGS